EVKAGHSTEAVKHQTLAADILTALHARLRQAQQDAVTKALAALKERAKSDLQAQKELEKLVPGSAEKLVNDYPENLKLADLQRIWDVAGAKKGAGDGKDELDFSTAKYEEVSRKAIDMEKDTGVRQDPYTLTLGTVPEKT